MKVCIRQSAGPAIPHGLQSTPTPLTEDAEARYPRCHRDWLEVRSQRAVYYATREPRFEVIPYLVHADRSRLAQFAQRVDKILWLNAEIACIWIDLAALSGSSRALT